LLVDEFSCREVNAMPAVSPDQIVEQLLGVLREAFEGTRAWSYFTDDGPQGCLTGTLASLDARAASRAVGGSSIAAHVHHLVFALQASAGWVRGERVRHYWEQSWAVQTVDAAQWEKLRGDLQAGYKALAAAIRAHALDSAEALGGSIGAIAHAAYHLGAIRQKLACS